MLQSTATQTCIACIFRVYKASTRVIWLTGLHLGVDYGHSFQLLASLVLLTDNDINCPKA